MGHISRTTAITGAVALAGAALMTGTAAHAAPIDDTQTGSIVVHKHVEEIIAHRGGEDVASTPDNPLGAPLEGVEFTAQQVLVDPDGSAGPLAAGPIDMTTAEGWTLAEQVFGATAPALPAGDAEGGPVFSLANVAVQTTNASGITTFNTPNLGVYLVTETGSGDNLIQAAAAPFWVSVPMPGDAGAWTYNVDVFPKNALNDFTPTKVVTANDLIDPDGNVEWMITTPIPASTLEYKSLVISDPAPVGMTFDSFGAMSLDGTALTADTDYTVDGTTITFTTDGLAKINAATTTGATAMITSVVNTVVDTIPANGQMVNTATVTLNGITKPASSNTNWGELVLTKTSNQGAAALKGAVFELYDADKAALITTGTTDADGILRFDLWVGNDLDLSENFWLKETVAPAGHVLPADPWTQVTVNAGAGADASTASIENHKATGPVLPMTGGTGIVLLTAVGLGITGITAMSMVISRRKKVSEQA